MSVSFVTSGKSATVGAASTFSATFNIGTCDTVVFSVETDGAAQVTFSAATWNAVNLFHVSGATSTANAGSGQLDWFALQAPANGSHTVSVTLTSGTSAWCIIGFQSFNNGDQTGGATSFNNGVAKNGGGADLTLSQAVGSANGDASVFCWVCGLAVSSESPTADWTDSTSGAAGGSAGQHTLSTSASDSYSVTLGSADQINGAGFHIKAAAAGVAQAQAQPRLLLGVGL